MSGEWSNISFSKFYYPPFDVKSIWFLYTFEALTFDWQLWGWSPTHQQAISWWAHTNHIMFTSTHLQRLWLHYSNQYNGHTASHLPECISQSNEEISSSDGPTGQSAPWTQAFNTRLTWESSPLCQWWLVYQLVGQIKHKISGLWSGITLIKISWSAMEITLVGHSDHITLTTN